MNYVSSNIFSTPYMHLKLKENTNSFCLGQISFGNKRTSFNTLADSHSNSDVGSRLFVGM
jgi:hypothetical protein